MITDVSYFLPGGRAGILLIHGLTGTPNEMHILANGLNRAGFTVYGMQLAGHCGDEADLIKTNWQDWYRSVDQAADRLLQCVDTLFVGGLSMGAVLALKLAGARPADVKGVAAYGPTFYYDGWSVPFYARKLYFLLKWFKTLGIFQHRAFIERPPYGVRDERIRRSVAESMQSGDSTKAGLAGNPWPALAEMLKLNTHVRHQLHKVRAPCLVMHSADDDIANIDSNARMVAEQVAGPSRLVPLVNSYHLITIDRDRKTVIRESVDFFTSLCRDHDRDIVPAVKVSSL